MFNNHGFVSIISLFVMAIILVSSVFLIYVSKLEYIILNSGRNGMQANYLAESKIYSVLNKEEYYDDWIIPMVKDYLRLGRVNDDYLTIRLDNKDLLEGDTNNKVDIELIKEDNNRRFMELRTHSTYNGITKYIMAKLTLINEFYDMGIPIVSINNINEDQFKNFEYYMSYLQKEITIPSLHKEITEIEAIDYENVNITKDLEGNVIIKFFRNNLEDPIRTQILNSNKVFLLAKNKTLSYPLVSILLENDLDKIALKGILYIEGDLNIYSNFEFSGILIINNGKLYIDPSIEVNLEGIVLIQDDVVSIENKDKIQVIYNMDAIRLYGIYLPKFVEPRIHIMKCF